ncbi:MAG: phosphoribosylamine--glycine ligase [Clostridiales bacterium]|nr:phosphoribosylamine--glycine ligase [Clostridiales bacterium]
MKILVVGGGGREHAILWKLAQSRHAPELHAAPGNGGIAQLAVCHDVKSTDLEGQLALARALAPDFVFVAPDDPLVLGLADRLREAGIPAFGPSAAAAEIEGSKVFSKGLMQKYGIPTAPYRAFDDYAQAQEHLAQQPCWPVVIKADGLALGKGVIIAQNPAEAQEALRAMMLEGAFGRAGARVVVEQFLQGPEVSVLAFTDGETLVPMVSAQDHKRAFDGDRGPNTGGMGAFSPSPAYTEEVAARCMERIFRPTVEAMQAEGRRFEGVLYFGLMIVDGEPMVIEYNCRFGDPETQAVLPLLQSDLVDICLAVMERRLDRQPVEWAEGACACVVLASGGYPGHYTTGHPICGLAQAQVQGALLFHAGTRAAEEGFVTAGGRVLGVTCTGDTLEEAVERAYRAADCISFEGGRCRRDIGQRPS